MSSTFSGKVWKFGHDINTDLVIPNFAVLMSVEEQLPALLQRQSPRLGRRGGSLVTSWSSAGTSGWDLPAISERCFEDSGSPASWRSRSTASGSATASTSGCRRSPARACSTYSKRAISPRSTGPPGRCATPPAALPSRAPHPTPATQLVAAGGVEDVLRAQGYLAPR